MSLSNQNCKIQPTLINLHPNEYSQEFHYYPFAVKLDRSCNTLNDLSNKVSVPNKTEDLYRGIFNMITRINELKILTKHISCKCKCRFDEKNVIHINGGIMINVNVNVKKRHACEKYFTWNPSTSNCENGKHLASVMDNWEIACDEIICESYAKLGPKDDDEEIKIIFNE